MTDILLPQAKVSQKQHIAPIWLLPIIALLVGVWLVWRSLLDMGPVITIEFESGEGIVANQTQVQYKGIPLGVVKSMKGKEDFSGVIATVQMDKRVYTHFDGVPRETLFWLVQPQVTLGGVSGLNTLFSGNYIGVQLPSKKVSGEYSEHFVALKAAPPLPTYVPGLHLTFKTDRLGSVGVGTPIYSRQIQVGSVQTAAMAPDGSGVVIGVHILPEYSNLVHKNTRFWNASGVRIEAGLSGIKVETDSVASLMAGGISMSMADASSPPSENGDVFYLHEDFEAAEASVFVNVEFPSADGLTKGVTRVLYKNITVGKLRDVWYDKDKDVVFGRFGIDPRFESFITDKTRFWLVRPQLSAAGIKGLDALATGSYLAFATNDQGTPVRDFTFQAADGPDPLDYTEPGLHLTLKSPTASVPVGAPVYYKDFMVGSVESQLLEGDAAGIHVLIKPEYRHLVNTSSRFWNVGGVQVNASLKDGVQVQSGPLMAMVAGGIAFDTPNTKGTKDLHDGETFVLFANEKKAKATVAGSAPGLYLTLESPDAGGITAGAPVLYRELPVGSVQEVKHGGDGRNVEIRILVDPEYVRYVQTDSRFWRYSGIEVTADSGGLNLRAGSLTNVMLGGIAFDCFTPVESDNTGIQSVVKRDDRFRLYAGHDEAANAGVLVSLTLTDAKGIGIGTEVRYRGMPVGEISRIQFGADLKQVIAELSLKQEAQRLLTSGTRFWKVQPAIGLARTANLDSLIGSYLQLVPGAGEPQLDFTLSEQEPVESARDSGLNLVLTADSLGSLKAGDPVLFRQVKVGEVLGSDLSADGKQVSVYINVWPQYAGHVHSKSRFWNVSGVRVKAGLFSGVKVDTESVESIISGGIAFSAEPDSGAASEGDVFTLYDKE